MFYRVQQGLRALTAWLRPVDYATAQAILSPPLVALFMQMRRSEQQHSLHVLASLRQMGHHHPDLLVAALLHDVGKSRARIGLVGRTLAVLARTFTPSLARRWAAGEERGWRRPFVVAERHPAWGAEMLAEAGAPPLAVTLVRRHQEWVNDPQTEEERLLAALQAADAAN